MVKFLNQWELALLLISSGSHCSWEPGSGCHYTHPRSARPFANKWILNSFV